MNLPQISVLMSVFNGEAFLSESIDSILNQSFDRFEFVIIDDGSTDGTTDILTSYAHRDRRLRIVRHENQGRAASLNVGIGIAEAKYIARMDADDIAMPGRLQEQVGFLEGNPEVGLLGGAFELIGPAGRVLRRIDPPLLDAEIRFAMLSYNPMCHSAVMMRRKICLASGAYRKALLDADDYDLWLRIGERSTFANLSSVLVRYRIHANQVSVRNLKQQALCALAAGAAAAARRSGKPDPLDGVEEITSQFVATLGVTPEALQRMLLEGYDWWLHLLKEVDPVPTLALVSSLSRLSDSGFVEPSIIANAWLIAAGIHYREGRPLQALSSAARALCVRPVIAGRPAKRAITRFAGALRNAVGMVRI